MRNPLLLALYLFLFQINLQAQDGRNSEQEEEVFIVVEEMPRFPGCEEQLDEAQRKECSESKLRQYVMEHLTYPTEALKNEIEGKVYVQFVVNEEGRIQGSKILRDIGSGCGAAALELVETFNSMQEPWIPGKQRGRAVKVLFTLPLQFRIPKDEITEVENVNSKSDTLLPSFPGFSHFVDQEERMSKSNTALIQHIYKNLNYPAEARNNSTDGQVVVEFTVTREGDVENAKIIKDLGSGCGQAALDAINTLKHLDKSWTPASVNGEAIDYVMTLPIMFRLESSKRKKKTKTSISDLESDNTDALKVVEKMPSFPGCDHLVDDKERTECSNRNLVTYIIENLKYPGLARENGIEGKVIIQFVVNLEGRIEDAKIIRDIGAECGEAALDMIYSMNEMEEPWTPGMQRGKTVRVMYTLPIHFNLPKKEKKKKRKKKKKN